MTNNNLELEQKIKDRIKELQTNPTEAENFENVQEIIDELKRFISSN